MHQMQITSVPGDPRIRETGGNATEPMNASAQQIGIPYDHRVQRSKSRPNDNRDPRQIPTTLSKFYNARYFLPHLIYSCHKTFRRMTSTDTRPQLKYVKDQIIKMGG